MSRPLDRIVVMNREPYPSGQVVECPYACPVFPTFWVILPDNEYWRPACGRHLNSVIKRALDEVGSVTVRKK